MVLVGKVYLDCYIVDKQAVRIKYLKVKYLNS